MTERIDTTHKDEIKINHHKLMRQLSYLDDHYYITMDQLMKIIEDCKDD